MLSDRNANEWMDKDENDNYIKDFPKDLSTQKDFFTWFNFEFEQLTEY